MIKKIMFSIFAILSVLDGIQAVVTWDHFGDMHAAWAGNSLIAAWAFAYFAFGGKIMT